MKRMFETIDQTAAFRYSQVAFGYNDQIHFVMSKDSDVVLTSAPKNQNGNLTIENIAAKKSMIDWLITETNLIKSPEEYAELIKKYVRGSYLVKENTVWFFNQEWLNGKKLNLKQYLKIYLPRLFGHLDLSPRIFSRAKICVFDDETIGFAEEFLIN